MAEIDNEKKLREELFNLRVKLETSDSLSDEERLQLEKEVKEAHRKYARQKFENLQNENRCSRTEQQESRRERRR